MDLDTSGWSGEGEFTRRLIDTIGTLDAVRLLKVEDAPASQGDAAVSFISNELFVVFTAVERVVRTVRLGFLPLRRRITEKSLTLAGLGSALAAADAVGEPDYSDDGMLQYLRVERIIPPYQTRGYKLVELVRIYDASARPAPRP